MKVRACLRCKQYIVIKEGYKASQALKLFDKDHAGHNMGILDYNEVKSQAAGYESKTNEYMDKV